MFVTNTVTDVQVISVGQAGPPGPPGDGTTTWTQVADKPLEYPPEAHTHNTTEISGVYNTLDLNTLSGVPTHLEGRMFYDPVARAISYYSDIVGSSLQVGLESWVRVRNTSGSTINEGEVVKITGANGQVPTVSKAIATTDANYDVLGVATSTMSNNSFGLITTFGTVNDLNTSGYPEGTVLYLSDTTPGAFTPTIPQPSSHPVAIGICQYEHASNGKVFVRVLAAGTNDDHVSIDTAPFTGILDGTDTSLHTVLNKIDAHLKTSTAYNLGTLTGTVTINPKNGKVQYGTVDSLTTMTMSAVNTSGIVTEVTLELTNPGTNFVMPGIKWAGGVPPTLTAIGTDILTFYTRNGTTWHGRVLSLDSK